nr:Rop family plasmid primer RNA-binding protein [Klebsiella pneumoniae]
MFSEFCGSPCERLHEDAETLWQVMRDKLGEE